MDVNARLNAAVKARDVRRVREALRKGGDPNHRERPEDRGLLYLAAAEGDVQIAAAMLEAGAKLACEPDTTVLHAAVLSRNPELMDLLLKAGGKRLINRFDGEGNTPLMLAVGQGDLEMARKLLDAGADPNARQEQPFGNTALRIATAEGTLEMVKLLMSAGADPLLPGRMTLTPLDRARERNTPEGRMITFFIERTLAAAKAAKSRPRRAKRATATRARK